MDATRKTFLNGLLFSVLCFVGIGLLLAFEYAKGEFSPSSLLTGFLMLIGGFFGWTVFRLSRGQATGSGERDSPELAGALKRLRVAVIILPVLLVSGFWITRDGPLFPRLFGAGINIFITC